MANTLTQLLQKVSYRMREDSVPSGSESSRRTQFINEGYKSILRKHFWWWTETSTTFNTVADQASYSSSDGFPSTIRGSAILELRVNGTLYTPVLQSDAFSLQTSGYTGFSESYMVFGKALYLLPPYGTSVTNGIAMKYYQVPVELSTGTDTILIPDEYADILVAFALGRLKAIGSQRGSAADAYDEFNEIYKEMEVEQNNYFFALKSNESNFTALYP